MEVRDRIDLSDPILSDAIISDNIVTSDLIGKVDNEGFKHYAPDLNGDDVISKDEYILFHAIINPEVDEAVSASRFEYYVDVLVNKNLEPFRTALNSSSPNKRVDAIYDIVDYHSLSLPHSAVMVFLESAFDNADPYVRRAVIFHNSNLFELSNKILYRAFVDESPEVRQQAFRTGMREDDMEAQLTTDNRIGLIAAGLKDPSPEVREAAAENIHHVLGCKNGAFEGMYKHFLVCKNVESEGMYKHFFELCMNDTSPLVRSAAMRNLNAAHEYRGLSDETHLNYLEMAMDDENFMVRGYVIGGLLLIAEEGRDAWERCGERCKSLFIKGWKDSNESVSKMAYDTYNMFPFVYKY